MKTLTPLFTDRDLSWLSFNARVLAEAENETVPVMERLNFLSIFSSNLDEFYKVRMPKLIEKEDKLLLKSIHKEILTQQESFGKTLHKILPQLHRNQMELIYDQPIPSFLDAKLRMYFNQDVTEHIDLHRFPQPKGHFLIKSNSLYQAVFITSPDGKVEVYVLKIPTNKHSRFYQMDHRNSRYIIFLDDIIKKYLPDSYFPGSTVKIWNFKVSRDANINFEKEEDILENLEAYLDSREKGKTTRFLYEKDMPLENLLKLLTILNIPFRDAVAGGTYHGLKDLNMITSTDPKLYYPELQPVERNSQEASISGLMDQRDFILHTPYESYDKVIDFFMEAAIDETVSELYITIYRTAKNSAIIEALMIAAKLGKKVTVFVELKARFDEENNLKWLRKMKNVGINIITSIPKLKVHAKVALVKRKDKKYALVSTGNFNEATARFYTDHILFTTHQEICNEIEALFHFLEKKRKPVSTDNLHFRHLTVGQFNLMSSLLDMIDREIKNQQEGKPAGIIIKVNNLEETVLIGRLYKASLAGVKIELIIRSICCLIPEIMTQSENIKVTRIVDRYLEHGRIFIFRNGGENSMLIGSSDLMKRSIYSRIEVLCPVYDPHVKNELLKIIEIQLKDNVKATEINVSLDNKPVSGGDREIRSQNEIRYLIARDFTELEDPEKVSEDQTI
ncbi:MAG: polyphosphate kinase 1 [Chryseobacterium sp.]|jgi:polyphosphate kinase|uniref:polyphosphate kinase 1 n=1 Tax=Chryseobacterium sp. TaxID=1871047 RepID=UPI00281D370E|nr:polyphosphate kinase 1 [Chryseobacterium sp.]MDR2236852.1 polyphosphate kinase 1 [Chryseobacterium sp.]